MDSYSASVFLHLLAVILGLGPLTALAVVASSATPYMPIERFGQLLRMVGRGLVATLATGVLVVHQTQGALGRTGWVRLSLGLFVVLGVLHAVVRRRVKRSRQATPAVAVPAGVGPLLWAMCALVATITYLMEAKPW